jgi:hypothetical protein
MKPILSITIFSLNFLTLASSQATAASATAADLQGKKICWSDGDVTTYGPGAKYTSTRDGAGTWSLGAAGLEIKAANWTYAASLEKQADGSFVEHYVGMGTTGPGNFTFTGRYCK